MRFKEFLSEEPVLTSSQKDTKEILLADCKPFFAEWNKSELVYRAMRFRDAGLAELNDSPLHVFNVGKNRKPTDTDPKLHQLIDDALFEKFKIRGRSECAFATGYIDEAKKYGKDTVFAFFPIGPFEFVWSPRITDAFRFFDDRDPEIAYEQIISGSVGYTNENLNEAIDSFNEIMFKCDSYYLLDRHHALQIFGL